MNITFKNICIGLSLIIAFSGIQAQERLGILYFNESIEVDQVFQEKATKSFGDYFVIYLEDTTHLPFVDDFTRRTNKVYSTDGLNDTTLWYDFTLSGAIVDDTITSFPAMQDTSYSYFLNNGNLDSTQNDFVVVHLYDNYQPSPAYQTDTVWQVPDSIWVDTAFTTTVPYDTLYEGRFDTVVLVPDDAVSNWINNEVYFNESYSLVPPSYGMATFDGLDSLGAPYDPSYGSTSYGIADYLTSKPLLLKTKPSGNVYLPSDSIYFSFYYQGGGVGEAPENQDSLILQFLDSSAVWRTVWATEGIDMPEFKQVMVPVRNERFLFDGFKFRFYNKAGLFGNVDHWNVDYIIIDEGRSKNDTNIVELAWREQGRSALKSFSKMPWLHYKANPNGLMADSISNVIYNNGPVTRSMPLTWEIEENGAVIGNGPQVVKGFIKDKEGTPVIESLYGFTFPTTNNDTIHTFNVSMIGKDSPDFNELNDTITYVQDFPTYYSYTDGTAEASYYIEGQGASIAVQYDIQVTDTLRAVNVYLPQSIDNITTRSFRIAVWDDLDNDPVYTGDYTFPQFSGGRDLFSRYELNEEVVVSGTFYVGIQQQADPIPVGIDKNWDASDKSFYEIAGEWYPMSYFGSLFIYPDFGSIYDPYPVSVAELSADPITFYPNPASDRLYIEGALNQIQIFDISGKLILQQNQNLQSIDISRLNSGIYILHCTLPNGESQVEKIVVE